MLCSVLIPSRWRFDKLKSSVQSFFDTANPDNFEVIVRLHETDEESVLRQGEVISLGSNVRVFVGRDKTSHECNNFLWNDIKPHATGVWHQYWSDDMTIHGEGWDDQLANLPVHGIIAHPKIHQLGPSEYLDHIGGPVPFIPADALSKYGFPEVPEPPDTTIDQLLRVKHGWKCHFMPGIRVYHNRENDRTITYF